MARKQSKSKSRTREMRSHKPAHRWCARDEETVNQLLAQARNVWPSSPAPLTKLVPVAFAEPRQDAPRLGNVLSLRDPRNETATRHFDAERLLDHWIEYLSTFADLIEQTGPLPGDQLHLVCHQGRFQAAFEPYGIEIETRLEWIIRERPAHADAARRAIADLRAGIRPETTKEREADEQAHQRTGEYPPHPGRVLDCWREIAKTYSGTVALLQPLHAPAVRLSLDEHVQWRCEIIRRDSDAIRSRRRGHAMKDLLSAFHRSRDTLLKAMKMAKLKIAKRGDKNHRYSDEDVLRMAANLMDTASQMDAKEVRDALTTLGIDPARLEYDSKTRI